MGSSAREQGRKGWRRTFTAKPRPETSKGADNEALSLGRLRPRSAVFFYSTLVRAGRREKHPRSLSSWLIRGKVKRREKCTKISSRKNQLHREEKWEGKFPSWGGVEGSQTWTAGSPEAPALGYFFNPPSWDTWGFGWVLSFLKTTKVEKQKTFPSLFLTLPEGAKVGSTQHRLEYKL